MMKKQIAFLVFSWAFLTGGFVHAAATECNFLDPPIDQGRIIIYEFPGVTCLGPGYEKYKNFFHELHHPALVEFIRRAPDNVPLFLGTMKQGRVAGEPRFLEEVQRSTGLIFEKSEQRIRGIFFVESVILGPFDLKKDTPFQFRYTFFDIPVSRAADVSEDIWPRGVRFPQQMLWDDADITLFANIPRDIFSIDDSEQLYGYLEDTYLRMISPSCTEKVRPI